MRIFACWWRHPKPRPWRLTFEPLPEFERQLFERDRRGAAPSPPTR